jgi:tetratricopeptide (TPR) repeat protein
MFFSKRFHQALVLVIAVSLAAGAWAQSDPIAIEVRYQNGVKYFNRGLYDRAASEFERVLEMDPSYEDAEVYLEKIRRRAEEDAAPPRKISRRPWKSSTRSSRRGRSTIMLPITRSAARSLSPES